MEGKQYFSLYEHCTNYELFLVMLVQVDLLPEAHIKDFIAVSCLCLPTSFQSVCVHMHHREFIACMT